ncbi:MAG: hydroxymethylglutaryl-CoA reductase, degradative [Flavobacteriaceae bacterium]|nr:hydroxymethylglutaryl-CoA reductase, degradative [Flavobacteriaceae bacterium]
MLEPVGKFSKKTKEEKIAWLCDSYLSHLPDAKTILKDYWLRDEDLQRLHDDFIENSISNYILPFGIAPNFLINDSLYTIPMVIEESSVVAAASNAAKFWLKRGGFKAEVIDTLKNGQIHLDYFGRKELLFEFFEEIQPKLLESIESIEKNMKRRGGGLDSLELIDKTDELEGYYQLSATFKTGDAMGANFINSCLEKMAATLEEHAQSFDAFHSERPEVVMSILSNYVPDCRVRANVSCPVEELDQEGLEGEQFAQKFVRAVDIAKNEVRRAVTHNKGIMNGIDAVIVATGNDFRAVEAGIHAYASKDGSYTSLTDASVEKGIFTFSIEIPLAIGTVGGLTSLHPMVRLAFEILQKPSAKELMQIVAVAGLAQNFAAIRSLVTTGIQKGHMKMHLMNILNQLQATPSEVSKAQDHFDKTSVSHSAVVDYIEQIRH